MTKSIEVITCPVCSSELTLDHLVGHVDDQRAFARLLALSIPGARSVMRYLTLFTPEKQRLTLRKKIRLIEQLLPDLVRQQITHSGRDWPAPPEAWEAAIEEMLAARARLRLPMTSHSYLYSVLATHANQQEAVAEQQREEERRTAPKQGTVQVRGQALSIGEGLQAVFGGKDPALAKLDDDTRNAAPIPADVLDRMNKIRRGEA